MAGSETHDHRATILYIEDNADNRLLIRRILSAEGYSVSEAESAAQALQVIQANLPDLILMDINMPDIDGYTLTAQLKAQPEFKNIPIIAMTANALKGDRERSLEAGCDGYIQKPIDVDDLTNQIARFLQAAGRISP
jgi:two-component system cell cycle response regulator DivK